MFHKSGTAEQVGGSDHHLKKRQTSFSSLDVENPVSSLGLGHGQVFLQDLQFTKDPEDVAICVDAFAKLVRRVQLYLISYLRKVNSGHNSSAIQRAARQAYAELVEGYSELVGPVRAHLCDKAESRVFQELQREVARDQEVAVGKAAVLSRTLTEASSEASTLPFVCSVDSNSDADGEHGTSSPAHPRFRRAMTKKDTSTRFESSFDIVKCFRSIANTQRRVEAIAESVISDCTEAGEHLDGSMYVDRELWPPKSLFHIIQETTWRMVSQAVKQQAGAQLQTLKAPSERNSLQEAVNIALATVESDVQRYFSAEHMKWAVRTTIVCKDFRSMLTVLKRLREDDRFALIEVKNRWGAARWRFPHVLVRASLKGTHVANARSVAEVAFEVRITHEKIAAVWRGEFGGKPPDKVTTLRSIFKVLYLGDPENHPSMWCISLGQLKQFTAMARVQLGPDEFSKASTTDVVKKVVMQATKAAGRSYACMLNWQQLLQVDVFISHAWAENFGEFVESVESALDSRVKADETSLWICSFALFQSTDPNDIKDQIGKDLTDAPFERALQRAKEFLVVRNKEVDLYSRAWCAYEVFRAHQLGIKIAVTGPDSFTQGSVDIMTCTATDKEDEARIKTAIQDAGEVEAINKIVSEIKSKRGSSG